MESRFKNKYSVGDVINNWIVIDSNIIYNKYRVPQLKVKCCCNLTEKLINISDIESGRSKSCRRCSGYIGYKDLSGVFWNNIKRGAISRNLEFNITIEQAYNLLEKQNFKCKLSNLDIFLHRNYSQGFREHQTASLDRIDSNKGYVIDNIQWIHSDINIMKNNYNQDYFIKMCKLISGNNNSTNEKNNNS
jgi:hypothetical protein